MSNAAASHEVPDVLRGLLDQFASGLAQVIESMADQKPQIGWQSGGEPAAGQDLLWWEQPFQIAPGMLLWAATPRPSWEYAGTLTLKAAGLETVETAEARNTWLEILGQALSGLARSIGGVVGREVACEAGTERAPEPLPDVTASISLRPSGKQGVRSDLSIGLSSEAEAFILEPIRQGSLSGETSMATEEVRVPCARHRAAEMPPTMELLLDVELPVSISFGKTEILMKDVLKLTTGSIVELNRGVNEPSNT